VVLGVGRARKCRQHLACCTEYHSFRRGPPGISSVTVIHTKSALTALTARLALVDVSRGSLHCLGAYITSPLSRSMVLSLTSARLSRVTPGQRLVTQHPCNFPSPASTMYSTSAYGYSHTPELHEFWYMSSTRFSAVRPLQARPGDPDDLSSQRDVQMPATSAVTHGIAT
jgi:hypothetical protein